PKGYHTRTFYDIPAGQSYTQDLLQPGGPCSGANFSGDWGDPFAMTAQINKDAAKRPPKDLGPGTVGGMAAKVMEVPAEGMPTPAKVWVEGKYGLVLKLDMAMPGKPQATLIEVKKVTFAKPPAGALAQPASCVAAGPPPPTDAEKIAAATAGHALAELLYGAAPDGTRRFHGADHHRLPGGRGSDCGPGPSGQLQDWRGAGRQGDFSRRRAEGTYQPTAEWRLAHRQRAGEVRRGDGIQQRRVQWGPHLSPVLRASNGAAARDE